MTIVPAAGGPRLEQVRALFRVYWDSFGFTPCFQGFGAEVKGLPGVYAPPDGRLGLALVDGEPAGCVALRRLDRERCEAKRLFVRPEFRGEGLGRALLEWIIAEARAAGYQWMYGDTIAEAMPTALAMYRRHGFQECEPYLEQPSPGAVCIRLDLRG